MSVSGRNRRYMQAATYTPRARRRTILDADLVARLDWILIGACVAIVMIGILMIYSASRNIVSGDPAYFVKRQLLALTIGLVIAMVLLRIDYRKFRDFSLIGYVLTVAMLFFVLSPIGSASKGHQAWYQLPFGFQFQPSEFAKFGLIVALAGYVNEHRDEIDPWRLSVIVGLALVPIGLVQLQPDLGTNMVLIFAVIGLLAVAGVRGRYLVALALLGMTLVFAVVSVGILQKYQVDRLTSVFDTSAQAKQGIAYNQDQSKKTISTGGFAGLGLFKGPQTRLGFVPEQQTDFIFTAVGEELGFVGGATLLALFAIVLWRTWRTAQLAADLYGTLVCTGVLAVFAFQIFENIGMTMGIMPVTGIPLPFMSYGG
ncbi:MAG TPA: FtsW/RodA/SpoVE family cell cycle protein, partial [Acidimicrobiia bacterium]